MKTAIRATGKLHGMGQSLWLDNITRSLLTSGTLNHYIQELSVTGLTSNPTIFDHAIKNSHDIDALAAQFHDEGARSFVKSWKDLMACIASRSEALK